MIAGTIDSILHGGRTGVFSHWCAGPDLGISQCQATNASPDRYSCVTRALPEPACEANSPTYRVEAPRASDAIGFALSKAFHNDNGVPDDMAALLHQLNQVEHDSLI